MIVILYLIIAGICYIPMYDVYSYNVEKMGMNRDDASMAMFFSLLCWPITIIPCLIVLWRRYETTSGRGK